MRSTSETNRFARRSRGSGVAPSGAVTSAQFLLDTIVTWRMPPWLALPTMPLPATTFARAAWSIGPLCIRLIQIWLNSLMPRS